MIGPHEAPYCESFAASSASESLETFTLSDAIAVQMHTHNRKYCIQYCNTLKKPTNGYTWTKIHR